jgi:pimeloyl-ACP methyl ester carboxylesterase
MYLPAGPEAVFAIATQPSGPGNGIGVLCLHAGVSSLTSHRNRMYTRLCREAAGAGCTALRMDYHGTGDSSGVLADRGIFGQTVDDVRAAVRWLTEHGVERIVAVGTCWGGLVALVSAAQLDAIVAVCLISPPLALVEAGADATERPGKQEQLGRAFRHALRPHVIKLLVTEREYRRWVLRRIRGRAQRVLARRLARRPLPPRGDEDDVRPSPHTVFAPLARRRVPLRVLYGEHDQAYRDLLAQGTMPALEAAAEIIEITVEPFAVHGFTSLRAQETTLQHARNCLARDFGITLRASPAGVAVGRLDHDGPSEVSARS